LKSYSLSGGIEKPEIEQIHLSALQLLERAGIVVPHARVRELLRDRPGITIEAERVRIEAGLASRVLADIVEMMRRRESRHEVGSSLQCSVGGLSLYVADLEDDRIREPTSADLASMVKLADSYGLSGVNPVTPSDIAPQVKELTIHRICLENGHDIGCGIMNSPIQAEYICEMNDVVGRATGFSVWTISPLLLGTDSLEMLYRLRNRTNIRVRVTNMPMLGATASINLGEAFCQSIAELLGALTVAVHVVDKEKIDFRIHTLLYPFDLRVGNCIYGSPESNLMDLFSMQISDFYGLPRAAVRGYKSMGKGHDIESAAERAFGVFAAALNGWREFFAAGRTCNDQVFSAIQLVVDMEILRYAQRFLEGYSLGDISNIEPLLTKIEEARSGNRTFLEQDDILTRDPTRSYWFPELFSYERLESWQAKGAIPIVEQARRIARDRIRSHEFTRGTAELKEIERIFRTATSGLL
jgi:trimethylamine:corrinoid methyltransferase-like protein